VRGPVHRAQDRPDPRRAGREPALHRFRGRDLQLRVEPGAQARAVLRRVPQRLGAHPRPGPPPGPQGPRNPLQHERGLQPRGHPDRPRAGLHRPHARRLRRPARGHRQGGPRLPRRAGPGHPLPPLQPHHPLHHARVPPGRDRAHRHLPHPGPGRGHVGQAQPDPPGPRAPARHPQRHPGLRHRGARRGLRPRSQVRRRHGDGEEPGRRGQGPPQPVRPQALQHPRGGEPPARVPRQREDDVHVGALPAPPDPHPGQPRHRGAGRRRAHQLLRRGRRQQLPRPRGRRHVSRHGVHRPAQARRLRPAPAVPGEPGGRHDVHGRRRPARLRQGRLGRTRSPVQPFPPRHPRRERRHLHAPGPAPGLQGRPRPGLLRLHRRALRRGLPHPPEHPRLHVARGPRPARGGHGRHPPHQPPARHHRQRLRPQVHRALRAQLLRLPPGHPRDQALRLRERHAGRARRGPRQGGEGGHRRRRPRRTVRRLLPGPHGVRGRDLRGPL